MCAASILGGKGQGGRVKVFESVYIYIYIYTSHVRICRVSIK